MIFIIYGVVAAVLTSIFFRLGALLRKQIPDNLLFMVGIAGVMSVQVILLTFILVLQVTETIGGNQFINLALPIPAAVGFGLGIFKGYQNQKKSY